MSVKTFEYTSLKLVKFDVENDILVDKWKLIFRSLLFYLHSILHLILLITHVKN